MADNIELVLNSVPASVFIGKYVKLKPLPNRSFVGLCPFHNEKSPSFRVNDEKKFFYCFGCHKGGNILNFLQDYKNIPFVEALNEIANDYSLKLEKFASKESHETSQNKALLDEVAKVFQAQLETTNGGEALLYLTKKRKLAGQTIKDFKLGFCPKEGDFLISYFPNHIEELLKLGLIGKRENGDFYNVFSDRITFPILNLKEQVIAFGARVYKKIQEEAKIAKYINSKESEFFKKGKVIYALEKAKKTRSSFIIVEGYLDVITMHQFGFKSTVAQMGTAFSEEQIQILFANSNEIIFCYDADEAGRKAEKRSIELCLPFLTPEKSISFLSLETKDADEFLNTHGAKAMQQKIASKAPLYEKIFQDFSINIDFKNPSQSSLCELKLLKFCDGIKDVILRKNYLSYFKNQIFAKKSNKYKAQAQVLIDTNKTNPRDAAMFALFTKFPQLLKSEYYSEHFVPFEDKTLQQILNKEAFLPEFEKEILQNQRLEKIETEEQALEFYNKIYSQFMVQNLKMDITKALEKGDIKKAQMLMQELSKAKI